MVVPPSLTEPARRRSGARLAATALVLALALAFGVTALNGFAPVSASAATKQAAKTKVRAASLTATTPKVSGVTATSAKVRLSGTVRLPSNLKNTARNRKKVRVGVTLEDSAKTKQSFTAKIDAKRRYAATKTTKLRGTLTVKVQARVGGKPSGRAVTKKVTVKAASASTGSGASGSTGGGSSTPIPVPAGAEKLVGLFRLDPGWDDAAGRIGGTWFSMQDPGITASTPAPPSSSPAEPNGGLPNANSTARNKQITHLRPGTDGGLRTDAFQEQPVPAFANVNPVSGGALASRIVLPQTFFGIDFSIVTDAVARSTQNDGSQTTESAPLPEIFAKDGRLYGQTTAWTAQWNGLNFNQGSPKPDGTRPAGTIPVDGTYDATTKRFVLTWRSLIVGGPFNGYHGYWHLEGTFVPVG